jgi:hypothetical protein
MKTGLLIVPLLLASGATVGDDLEQKPATDTTTAEAKAVVAKDDGAKTEAGPKRISGMSILGNQDAPKSLVIVPWKSSEIGDAVGIAALLDDSRRPVDRDVFARELAYYQVKVESK